jgi:hypothetical protein
MFNSLRYAKSLEEAGLPRAQAEAHVLILTEIMETNLATKLDIRELEQRLAVSADSLEQKIIQSEQRMTIKLGTIVSIAIGVAVTLAKMVG